MLPLFFFTSYSGMKKSKVSIYRKRRKDVPRLFAGVLLFPSLLQLSHTALRDRRYGWLWANRRHERNQGVLASRKRSAFNIGRWGRINRTLQGTVVG